MCRRAAVCSPLDPRNGGAGNHYERDPGPLDGDPVQGLGGLEPAGAYWEGFATVYHDFGLGYYEFGLDA